MSARDFGEEHKMLKSYQRVADAQNKEKRLNNHSESCLFCLQFMEITVYSLCHTSVAFFFENVAEGG